MKISRYILFALAALPALAPAVEPLTLVIENHRFEPAELVVPAGQKLKVLIENRDSTPEEFESYTLNREKIIAGKSTAVVWIGPLTPGRYAFFGEFNQKTAQGFIVAK
jgi:Cupredoxin-like domain